jgi:hypothetical protein
MSRGLSILTPIQGGDASDYEIISGLDNEEEAEAADKIAPEDVIEL